MYSFDTLQKIRRNYIVNLTIATVCDLITYYFRATGHRSSKIEYAYTHILLFLQNKPMYGF